MEKEFYVNTRRLFDYADTYDARKRQAYELCALLSSAKRMAEMLPADTAGRYNLLIREAEALTEFFRGLSNGSREIAYDTDHAVKIIHAILEEAGEASAHSFDFLDS